MVAKRVICHGRSIPASLAGGCRADAIRATAPGRDRSRPDAVVHQTVFNSSGYLHNPAPGSHAQLVDLPDNSMISPWTFQDCAALSYLETSDPSTQ